MAWSASTAQRVGKTTLIEAIRFACYGNARTDQWDSGRPGGGGLRVELEFEHEGHLRRASAAEGAPVSPVGRTGSWPPSGAGGQRYVPRVLGMDHRVPRVGVRRAEAAAAFSARLPRTAGVWSSTCSASARRAGLDKVRDQARDARAAATGPGPGCPTSTSWRRPPPRPRPSGDAPARSTGTPPPRATAATGVAAAEQATAAAEQADGPRGAASQGRPGRAGPSHRPRPTPRGRAAGRPGRARARGRRRSVADWPRGRGLAALEQAEGQAAVRPTLSPPSRPPRGARGPRARPGQPEADAEGRGRSRPGRCRAGPR